MKRIFRKIGKAEINAIYYKGEKINLKKLKKELDEELKEEGFCYIPVIQIDNIDLKNKIIEFAFETYEC